MTLARIRRRFPTTLAAGAILALGAVGMVSMGVSWSSGPSFCMSCHEMRVVGEQGWMRSIHYQNDKGVVASCSDCHVPHSLLSKLFVKARDGGKDVFVHLFGQSDPHRMNWDELALSARSKIYDESCTSCHENPTPVGMSIKGLVAHREYLRMETRKPCLECHVEPFHGDFKDHLFGRDNEGGTQ